MRTEDLGMLREAQELARVTKRMIAERQALLRPQLRSRRLVRGKAREGINGRISWSPFVGDDVGAYQHGMTRVTQEHDTSLWMDPVGQRLAVHKTPL